MAMAPEEIKLKELEEELQAATAELEKQRREAEALREGETRYRKLFDKMAEGFALHEIVTDEEGRPCDYRFLEINPAFERLTGLKRGDVVGRGVREVLPGIEEHWIETFGKVALTGEPAQVEDYAAPLDRWYEVFAYRPAAGQFAVVFVDISKRRRAEERLAAAHRRIQKIIDNTPDIVYAFDLEERFVMANAAVAKVLGSTPEEMIGKRRHEFMPEEDADRHETNDRLVIEAGRMLEFEEYSQLEGRSITWLTKKFPLRDAQGRIYAVGGISADISERKKAEEVLRESEGRFRLALANSPVTVAALDANLRYTWVYSTRHGLTPEAVIGKRPGELTDPTDAAELIELYHEVLSAGAEVRREVTGRVGGKRWVYDVTAEPRRDERGNIVGLAVAIVDVTERKQAEEVVRRERGMLGSVLTATDVQIAFLDREFNFVLANAAYAEASGVSVETLIGQNHFALFPHEENEGIFRRVRDTGEPVFYKDKPFEYPDQPERGVTYWDWSLVPVKDEAGHVEGVVLSLRETTEFVRAQEAVRRSEARYRTLFESIDQGFCVIEMIFDDGGKPVDYRFLEMNPAFEKQTGLTGALGKTIRELVPDIEPFWPATYGEVVVTGRSMRFERQSESMGIWFDVYVFRVGEPHEHKVAVLFSNITERKRAEEAVRESEQRLRLAAESAHLGVFEWDVRADAAVWENERMFEIFGMSPGAEPFSKEQFVREVIHPDDQGRFGAEMAESVRSRGLFREAYRVRRSSDGEWRWIEFFSRFEFTSEGEARRLVGVLEDVTERKEIEAAVRRLAQFPEENPNPVLRVAMDNTLLYANIPARNLLARFGWRPEGLLPAPILSLAAAAVGHGSAIEEEISFPDGSAFTVSAIQPAWESYVNLYLRDITERKRVEEAVREANEVIARQLAEIESIYHGAAIGLCVLDAEHRWVRINERLAEINGYSVDEHIGKRVEELLPDVARAVSPLFDRIITTGEPLRGFEYQAETKAQPGEVRDFVGDWLPLKDASGQVFAINIVVQEVTERKRAEREIARINEELQTANEELAAVNEELQTANEELARQAHELAAANQRVAGILGSITECYLLLDRDWRILDMNANSAGVIFGGPKERFVGTRLWNLAKAELEQNAFYHQYSRAFREGGPVHFEAHSHITEERWLEVHAYPSEDKGTLAVYFHDISDRKRAQLEAAEANEELGAMNEELQTSNDELARANEEVRLANEQLKERTRQLEMANEQLDQRKEELAEVNSRLVRANQDLLEANTELGRFGAYLSHDLRAPLRTIRGFSEIFVEDYGEQLGEEGRELAERMVRAAEKAGEIIADIERLTGLDAVTFAPEEIDLRDIAQDWLASLRAREAERECRLELAEDLQVRADRRLMTAALTNLFENAFKYSAERESAVISFGCESRGEERVFYVKDNGAGFDMRQAEKLFKPFSRLHDSSTFSGTGLGLAIVRKVIARHGGRVWAEASPGSGATFYFTVGQ